MFNWDGIFPIYSGIAGSVNLSGIKNIKAEL
jgi:hypothetical protein